MDCPVRRSCSESEKSDNDAVYADEHDNTVQQVSLCHNRLTPTAVNACGEGCAQLDDFNWFLPADDWAGDPLTLESEMEESDNEYFEPDSTQLQMDTRAQQLLGPPVVAQTRPMQGYYQASPRRSCRGRDVLTEDGAEAVDTEQVEVLRLKLTLAKIRDRNGYMISGQSDTPICSYLQIGLYLDWALSHSGHSWLDGRHSATPR